MFTTGDTTIICIDLQKKLTDMLDENSIVNNAKKLLQAANILNIDTILTEQYPKGLGETIEDIKAIKDFKTIEKTTFSALQTKDFEQEFAKLKNKNILIFGIETHICVLQTVIDLLQKNYNVFVLKDCSASRDKSNHKTALNLMQQEGAKIITLEIALFNFLKSSKHPNFKEIQALIK